MCFVMLLFVFYVYILRDSKIIPLGPLGTLLARKYAAASKTTAPAEEEDDGDVEEEEDADDGDFGVKKTKRKVAKAG